MRTASAHSCTPSARDACSIDVAPLCATADWYMPVVLDVKDKLTATEVKNEALIKRYENYGAKYYDRFGR